MSESEFTAKDALEILRPLVGHGRQLTLAYLSFYKRSGFLRPSGQTETRGRRRYSVADIIALAFLLEMGAFGLPARRALKQSRALQMRTDWPRNLVTKGSKGRLSYEHRTGELAALVLRAIDARERKAA